MEELEEVIEEEEKSIEEVRKELIQLEAEGKRPPASRKGNIVLVIGEKPTRIFVIQYYDMYVFMKEEDAPKSMPDNPVGMKVAFKPVRIEENKVVVSHKAIKDYYRTAMERGTILSGKIISLIPSRNSYGFDAIIVCRGDKIFVPANEFVLPSFLKPEEKLGRIVDFQVIKVEGTIYASIKKVFDMRQAQLNNFLESGESFTATVEKVEEFGAFLTYKDNNDLVLRNRDFSTDFTLVKDVLKPGDKVKLKVKYASKYSKKLVVEMAEKYAVKPDINFEDIEIGGQFDGEVITVSTFGCFVRIGAGRDVLCPIDIERREPLERDKVRIEIVVADKKSEKLRGKVIHFIEDKIDLSKYAWLNA